MDNLMKIVEKELGVNKSSIISKTRVAEIVKARSLFVIIAKKNGYSLSSIGRFISRDHSTVGWCYESNKDSKWINDLCEKYDGVSLDKPFVSVKLSGRYGYLHDIFEGKCVVCGFDEVVEVHHIVPRRLGGGDEKENLVLLCPNHHALADRGMLSIKGIHSKISYPQA